jgi:hypothetical protein
MGLASRGRFVSINRIGRCLAERKHQSHMSSRYFFAWFVLVAAAVSWPGAAASGGRQVFVVITPPARPQPQPPQSFPPQLPLQWTPSPALGSIPGRRLPAARCFTKERDCPLEQLDRLGKSCSCGDALPGRAMIPPSRDITGKRVQFD